MKFFSILAVILSLSLFSASAHAQEEVIDLNEEANDDIYKKCNADFCKEKEEELERFRKCLKKDKLVEGSEAGIKKCGENPWHGCCN